MGSYIDGIYNYCDRRCEHCAFTSRCRNYATVAEMKVINVNVDGEITDDVAGSINKILENTKALLEKVAEEHGFDLNAMPEEEEHQEADNRSASRDELGSNPVLMHYRQYEKTAAPFIRNRQNFRGKLLEFVREHKLGICSVEEKMSVVKEISDALEGIDYYLSFIEAKLYRALSGKLDDEELALDDYPKDSDGSAKIASICIEKTVIAWFVLYEHFPEHEDVILKALAVLEKIKQLMSAEFPDAMNFIRPGFDTSPVL